MQGVKLSIRTCFRIFEEIRRKLRIAHRIVLELNIFLSNLFHAAGLFLYPLKTSEDLWIFYFSGCIETDQ